MQERSSSTSNAIRLLATSLALAMAATLMALVASASPAEAVAPQCYATVQGTSITPEGASDCYYVVVRHSDWKKVCEGYDASFSCNNLKDGEYQVQSYGTNPWHKVSQGTVVISKPGNGTDCDKLVTSPGNIGGGHHDGSCYYVVMDTSDWTRVCEGYVFTKGCGDLDAGKYKVDVYSTSPWKKLRSDYLNVG